MARRVNTKFLTVLTIVVVVLGVAALAANKFLVKQSPEKFVGLGTTAMTEKRYEDAAKHFAQAVSLDKNNPSLWVAYGDALNEMSHLDAENLRKARSAWDQALIVDPNNLPALDRMMQFWSDLANLSSINPEIFKQLGETAARLHAADPRNAAAKIAVQTSIIRPWLAGVERDEDEIKKTIRNLEALMREFPDNADLPLFAAQGRLRLAERARQRDRNEEAVRYIVEADKLMDAAVQRTPTAAVYFSAAQVAQMQEHLAGAAAVSADWKKKKNEFFAKAREMSTADDPLYVHIHIAAARAAGDTPGESETILRSLLQKHPEDQQVRLALAEELARDEKTRAEALEILEKPFATSTLKGPRAFLIRELQIRTLIMATNLRLDQFATAAGNKLEQDKLLPKIRETLMVIEQKDGVDSARPLRLRGKLLRLQGDNIRAIQTLERARQIAEKNANSVDAGGDRLDRWEVIDLLARCYVETGQTGRAKQLLTELHHKFPTYEPSRMLLAQILLREGSLPEARAHIDYLTTRRPNDPDVIKLKLQVLDKDKGVASTDKNQPQAEQLKVTYGTLPESTKAEILDKVIAAMAVEQQDDAIRLLEKAQQEFPGDYEVARTGVRVYRFLGQLDKVKEFVETAYNANPKDERLQTIRRQVQDLTPEAMAKFFEEEIAKEQDPVKRAMQFAEFYSRQNRHDEAFAKLTEAQKLKPNDPVITSMMFRHHLRRQQFDRAEALLDKLAAADADKTGGLLYRYQLAMAKGDFAAAEKQARDLVQKMGEFGQSWLALAQALQAQNKTDDALSKYLVALEKQSDSSEALRGIIDCYYALSRPSDARKYIAQARRAMPGDASFKEIEVRHELSYGTPEKALPAREEAVQKNPDNADMILSLGQAYLAVARAHQLKPDPSRPKFASDMFVKAKQAFRQGITKWPDEIAFYAYYAETAARDGQLGESEKLLKQLAAREMWKDKSEPRALLAEYFAVIRRFNDAELIFREILAKEPTNSDVQVRLANLLTSQGKIDDALAVLQTNVQDAKVARRRVEILIASDRGDEADQVVTDALTKSPSNLDLLHLGASVDMNASRFDRAEKRLSRALEIDSGNATTRYYVGMLRMKQPKPDYELAIRELTLGRDSATMGTEARFALSDCLRRLGNAEGALRELEGALSSQPGNMRVRLGLVDAYLNSIPPRWNDAERVINDAKALPGYVPNADLLDREATMRASRNEPEKALAAMREARQTAPNDMTIARKYVERLLSLKKWPDVIAETTSLIGTDRLAWWAYSARATALRGQGKKEEAIKDFDAALGVANELRDDNAADVIVRTMGNVIGPDEVMLRIAGRAETDDRWKFMIARLQATKGDNAAAAKTLEQILVNEEKLHPQVRESTLRFGGMLYLILNQPDKSARCYERLLALAPNDTISLNNMASLLAESVQPPRPQEGIKYSQHAYGLMRSAGRRDSVVMDTHGWLLVLTGKLDEGIELLRSALEVRPIPDIHYHLGEAYLRKGYTDQAIRELERSMDMIKRQQQEQGMQDLYMQQLLARVESAMAKAAVAGRKPAANGPIGANVP